MRQRFPVHERVHTSNATFIALLVGAYLPGKGVSLHLAMFVLSLLVDGPIESRHTNLTAYPMADTISLPHDFATRLPFAFFLGVSVMVSPVAHVVSI